MKEKRPTPSEGFYRETPVRKPFWMRLLSILLVLVLGAIGGLVIFKILGEDHFTSPGPIIAEPPEEEPLELPPPDPKSLVENGNHILAAAPYAYATREVREWITGQVPYAGEKLAFLTFDDGPSAENTERILDILKEKEAVGTFFLIGSHVERNARSGDIIRRILMEGSGVAIHSYTHDYNRLYPGRTGDADVILQEIMETQTLIQEVLDEPFFQSRVFRYPGGHMSWRGLEAVDEHLGGFGIEYVDWNAMNGDSEPTARRPRDVESTVEFVFDSLNYTRVRDVIVVLMHDAGNRNLTVEALPQIIQRLREEGYRFGILK